MPNNKEDEMANKKGAGFGVPGTPMLASHFSIPPINTPLPSIFGKNHVRIGRKR